MKIIISFNMTKEAFRWNTWPWLCYEYLRAARDFALLPHLLPSVAAAVELGIYLSSSISSKLVKTDIIPSSTMLQTHPTQDNYSMYPVSASSSRSKVESSILKFFSVGDWYKLSLLMLEIFKLASEQGKHIMDFNGSEFPCFSLVLGRASVQWWRSVINSATVSRNRKYK